MVKKVLLIGLGNMGQHHFRVLNELKEQYKLEIKTCDIEKEADYKEISPAIFDFIPEFIIIATPTPTHEKILDFCLISKIPHILVEKPIVDKVGSLNKYKSKDNIMVGHIERFNPIIQYIKKNIPLNYIDTVICTRSGLSKEEEDYNVGIDLSIHDIDVCHYLFNNDKILCFNKTTKNNSFNSVLIGEGYNDFEIFLHADNKSPFKRRMIQIIGKDLFIEGDYIKQTLNVNGKNIKIKKQEPLKVELEYFFNRTYSNKDLKDAINNVKLLK